MVVIVIVVNLKIKSTPTLNISSCFKLGSMLAQSLTIQDHNNSGRLKKTTEDKTGLYKIIQDQTKCLFTFKFSKYVKFHFIERLTQLKMYLRHYSKKLSIDQPRSAGLYTFHFSNKQCI